MIQAALRQRIQQRCLPNDWKIGEWLLFGVDGSRFERGHRLTDRLSEGMIDTYQQKTKLPPAKAGGFESFVSYGLKVLRSRATSRRLVSNEPVVGCSSDTTGPSAQGTRYPEEFVAATEMPILLKAGISPRTRSFRTQRRMNSSIKPKGFV